MLSDLSKMSDTTFDWLDKNFKLLDDSVAEFFAKLFSEAEGPGGPELNYVLMFLLDAEGANLNIETLVDHVYNEGYFNWNYIDEWNEQCAKIGINNTIQHKLSMGIYSVIHALRNLPVNAVSRSDVIDIITKKLDYTSTLITTRIPSLGSDCTFSIQDIAARPTEYYIPLQVWGDEEWLPKDWKPVKIPNMPTLPPNHVRTVSRNKTLYFSSKCHTRYAVTDLPVIFISAKHVAKTGSENVRSDTFLPKNILEMYGMPIATY